MSLLESSIEKIKSPDSVAYEAARTRLRDQARPAGSLGILEDVGARLAGIFGTVDVHLKRKVIITCAGDHGVCEEGVSVFPQEVTVHMVHNFVNNGASINVLAKHAGAEVKVADLGVNYDFDPALPVFHKKVRKGTANFTREPAMTRDEARKSIEAGIEIVGELMADGPVHLLGTGDMGIGNTSPSTAIIAVYSGMGIPELTGRGTGVDDAGLSRKIAALEKGLVLHHPDPADPLGVLAAVGGLEIGGLAGLVIGAAANGIPVICDGLIATAGALIACELAPAARDYLFASHYSVEVGHAFMLKHLGLRALLDLEFRLGEGTGAALAMELMDASTRIVADIKTFEEIAMQDPQK